MRNTPKKNRHQNAVRQEDSLHSCVLQAFECLLADISRITGVPLGAPSKTSYELVTIELPKLDKALLQYIEGTGGLPEFPEWIRPLSDKFLSTLDSELLRWLRQLLLFCYKIEHEPTHEQIAEAQASFESVDESIGVWDSAFADSNPPALFTHARKIIGRIIYRLDWGSIVPSHGPGAVFPPSRPSKKSRFDTIYTAIESHYPFADYFCALPSFWDEYIWQRNRDLRVSDTVMCRLVAVPKDSRGPRLICVHPKEAIWIQQGCRRILEDAITSRNSPCHGRISFTDQTINGNIALHSSESREFCTLDLKEASDRISCKLVKFLFGNFAYEKLSCSRATSVLLLDGRVMVLRKWAPMGNALTFPVESLVFWALIHAGIYVYYGDSCSDIYVFGDDCIFPVKYYSGVLRSLVRAGLVPNASKTFKHGFFRESCGVDAYRGKDVTPYRLRRVIASSGSDGLSIVTLARELSKDRLYKTSDFLYRQVSKRFGPLPISNNPNAQALCRYEDCSFDKLLVNEPSLFFNEVFHKWQTRATLVRGVGDHAPKDAWWHLQDSLLLLHRNGGEVPGIRGLEYTVPRRSRSYRGSVDAIVK